MIKSWLPVALFLIPNWAGAATRERTIPPGLSWSYDLSGGIPKGTEIIDYDPLLGSGDNSQVAKKPARFTICYFSAGSWEKGRPDMANLMRDQDYKNPLKGGNSNGQWISHGEPERWLNIDSPAVRAVMLGRLIDARNRGCDAVEPDNLDGDLSKEAATGFGKTKAQIIAYYRFLSTAARGFGLKIGLKNGDEIASEVVAHFDFVVAESCFDFGREARNKFGECAKYDAFLDQNKAVLIAQYGSVNEELCRLAKLKRYSLTFFPRDRNVSNGIPCR